MFGKMVRFSFASCALMLLLGLSGVPAILAADNQDGPVSALKAKYTITQTTMNRSQITQPGTTMAVVANGISAVPWDWAIPCDNSVTDGQVQQSRMKEFKCGKDLKILQPGDKLYVTKIETKQDNKNDLLKMSMLSADELDTRSGEKKRFAASVTFKLAKNALSETPPDQLESIVEAIVKPDAGGDQSTGSNNTASSAPAAAQAPPAPAPTPAPAPAPAPPPAAAPSRRTTYACWRSRACGPGCSSASSRAWTSACPAWCNAPRAGCNR